MDRIFSYSWSINEEEENLTEIRIWGLNYNNKSVCLKIRDFSPYIYLELPDNYDYFRNMHLITEIRNKISSICGKNNEPLGAELVKKKKLYGAQIDNNKKQIYFPYLKLWFATKNQIKQFSWKCKKWYTIIGIGRIKFKIHEDNATPILQLVCNQNIPTAGWISFPKKDVDKDKDTYCDFEYTLSYKHLKRVKLETIVKPLILSFDIEVNSGNPNRFPNADKPTDKIFQISSIIWREGGISKKILLSLGNPIKCGKDVEIIHCDNEANLLLKFRDIIITYNPQILVGYNILGFDLPYMIKRCEYPCYCKNIFNKLGLIKDKYYEDKKISWSSSAYKNQEFEFIDLDGRIFVDLLPLVQRDYKFDQYTLKRVSTFFIGETKDPLTHKDIFRGYKLGMEDTEKGRQALGVVGKYCVQDSVLVQKLFDKLQIWVGLCEMAKTCNVPIFYLFTQGQQIKVFSQVYKLCFCKNFIVEKDGYIPDEDEEYTGATVFPPIPGLYEKVIPFDFASLYPTTIIAYNIDYSTFVDDKSNIPDKDCNIIEWEDHVGCEHDTEKRATKPTKIICAKRRYRFLKEPKGVMPTLLEYLLTTRKKTKTEMKSLKRKLKEDNTLDEKQKIDLSKKIIVLDKRQLAYKVSANSMYGSMGVKRGYLPFLPGAMSTTARGRQSIQKAAKVIQEQYGGQLVYGDTDSCYIHFPTLKTSQECWDYSLRVENDVSNLFPKPMKLEFEEAIYWRFFILSKKRYMALSCGRDGILSDDIEKKGVVLARRDNSKLIRELYEKVIMMIFNKEDLSNTLYFIISYFNKLCGRCFDQSYFLITKSVGNPKDYKIKELPTDEKKLRKRLEDLDIFVNDINNKKEYWSKYVERCLPAHIQLAEKMKRRGVPVEIGSRLEYLITEGDGHTAKQFNKLEDPKYQKKFSRIVKIDYLYYLKLCVPPIDQLL